MQKQLPGLLESKVDRVLRLNKQVSYFRIITMNRTMKKTLNTADRNYTVRGL